MIARRFYFFNTEKKNFSFSLFRRFLTKFLFLFPGPSVIILSSIVKIVTVPCFYGEQIRSDLFAGPAQPYPPKTRKLPRSPALGCGLCGGKL